MPIQAGQKITAGRLNWDMDAIALDDTTTFTAAGGSQQWGNQELTFANPGIPVKVKAELSGRLLNTIDADSLATAQVGISFDGGFSFTYGNSPQVNVGTSGAARGYVGAKHFVSGTPTGDIVIRAEVDVSDDDVDGRSGHINAVIVPQ